MKKIYTCIVCPMGCRIAVEVLDDKLTVSGYTCERGHRYAINEHKDPKRKLTSTVRVENSILRRLPVASEAEIPKNMLEDCLKVVYSTSVSAPVRRGDVIIKNICDTGIDIIASRNIDFL